MTLPVVNSRLTCAMDLFESFDVDGSRSFALVLKQRFHWTPAGHVARVPGAEVHAIDVPWPDAMSPRFPNDYCLRKHTTDVVVAGSAVAGAPVKSLDVMVRVGPVQKALRVHGQRVWYRGALGLRPTEAIEFESLPLMWEHAYGGADYDDPANAVDEPRNPLGIGVASDSSTLDTQAAPRIEDPADPIDSPSPRAPAGVAAIPSHFEPRRSFAGTFDQRWQDERMPLFPEDFDERFNQVAAPGLMTPTPLLGNEPVQLFNLGRPGPVEFSLPRVVFQVEAVTDSGTVGRRPLLDTVVLMPDTQEFDLVWRTAFPIRQGIGKVRDLRVYEKQVVS